MKIPTGARNEQESPRNIDLDRSAETERIRNPYVKELLTPAEALDAISLLAREVEIDRRLHGR